MSAAAVSTVRVALARSGAASRADARSLVRDASANVVRIVVSGVVSGVGRARVARVARDASRVVIARVVVVVADASRARKPRASRSSRCVGSIVARDARGSSSTTHLVRRNSIRVERGVARREGVRSQHVEAVFNAA